MKSILALFVVVWSFQSYALPVASNLGELQQDNIVNVTSVPGSEDDNAKLAVTVKYSNRCVAEQNTLVYQTQDDSTDLNLYSIWGTDRLCTAEHRPVTRVSLINVNYELGDKVTINGHTTIKVTTPEPAICIQSLCDDGESRDAYTCACPNGFFR